MVPPLFSYPQFRNFYVKKFYAYFYSENVIKMLWLFVFVSVCSTLPQILLHITESAYRPYQSIDCNCCSVNTILSYRIDSNRTDNQTNSRQFENGAEEEQKKIEMHPISNIESNARIIWFGIPDSILTFL